MVNSVKLIRRGSWNLHRLEIASFLPIHTFSPSHLSHRFFSNHRSSSSRTFLENSKLEARSALSFHAFRREGEESERKMKERKWGREEKKGEEKSATVLFPICSLPGRFVLGSLGGAACTRVRTNARTPTKRQPPGSKSPVKAGIVNFWRFPPVAMHQPTRDIRLRETRLSHFLPGFNSPSERSCTGAVRIETVFERERISRSDESSFQTTRRLLSARGVTNASPCKMVF